MVAKDIKVGVEYATMQWHKLDHMELLLTYGREGSEPPRGSDWASSWRSTLRELSMWAQRCVVTEKGVQHDGYARPGVRVTLLDPYSGEPLADREPETRRTVQIIMEWDRLQQTVLDVMSVYEEEQEQKRLDQERHKREEQERRAREWMERVFEEAREDLENMLHIGVIKAFSDKNVKALVDQRYPEGNPYLNGEEE